MGRHWRAQFQPGLTAAPYFGAMQEMVFGLHLVTGPNRHVYLERKSYPVMGPDFPESIGAEFIRDDVLFNAALVGLGSFGIPTMQRSRQRSPRAIPPLFPCP
jgi:hypothetical protein